MQTPSQALIVPNEEEMHNWYGNVISFSHRFLLSFFDKTPFASKVSPHILRKMIKNPANPTEAIVLSALSEELELLRDCCPERRGSMTIFVAKSAIELLSRLEEDRPKAGHQFCTVDYYPSGRRENIMARSNHVLICAQDRPRIGGFRICAMNEPLIYERMIDPNLIKGMSTCYCGPQGDWDSRVPCPHGFQ